MNFKSSSTEINAHDSIQSNMYNESYGLPSVMTHGPMSSQSQRYSHPLELSKSTFQKNQLRQDMMMMRNIQGLHAPMRLAMELKAADQIGRHPFLPSSHLMKDVLLARDEDIGFEDILNTAEFNEKMGQPHAIVEKQLGIL